MAWRTLEKKGFSTSLTKIVASVSKYGAQDSAKPLSASVKHLHGLCQPTTSLGAHSDLNLSADRWSFRIQKTRFQRLRRRKTERTPAKKRTPASRAPTPLLNSVRFRRASLPPQLKMSHDASSSTGRGSKRARRPSQSPTPSAGSGQAEPRRKAANDREPILGLSQTQPEENYQDEYRPVPASDIGELPQRKYGDVVQKGKLTTRHSYTKIPSIAGPLLAAFPNVVTDYPQLGNFLLLDGQGVVPNAAIHQLMARVCVWPDQKKQRFRLFVTNNMVARLSPLEFSLITGLHFSDFRSQDDVDGDDADLKERAFPAHDLAKKQVTTQELVKKIESLLAKRRPERYPDVINLTFVWLIQTLLDIPNRQTHIPDEYFELCSNLDVCQKNPWGRRVWKAIVDDCFEQIGPIDGPGTRSWNAYGFIHFFAFYMMEAFEGAVVKLNASPRRDYIHSYPRMLRYSLSNNAPQGDDMKNFFASGVQVVYPRLKPDVEELMSPAFYGTLCWFQRNYYGREADALRLNDDGIFCTDYVKFISPAPARAPRQRTPPPPPQTTYSAFPETVLDHVGPSSSQAQPSGGPPYWFADFLQMHMDERTADMERERLRDQRETAMLAELTEQKKLVRELLERVDKYGVEQGKQGEMIAEVCTRIDALQAALDRCNLGDRADEEVQ